MKQGSIDGLSMKVMRAWMWFVPVAMLAASALFGFLAASDGRWGLLVAMVGLGVTALGLLTLHWWLLYRFGARPQEGQR